MGMYRLNEHVLYNEQEAELRTTVDGDAILLAPSTNRLLHLLILNQGIPVTRDTLFKLVWDDHGLRSSNANLNQYISLLRRQLSDVGLPKDIIVTIPKIGFMIDKTIDITLIDESPFPSLLPGEGEEKEKYKSKITIISACTALFLLFLLAFFFISGDEQQLPKFKFQPIANNSIECNIYSLSNTTTSLSDASELKRLKDCNTSFDYFIYFNHEQKGRELISWCKKDPENPNAFIYCKNESRNVI
ncbi:winged helix-turn-helix domain-containing protein [Edwardsiella tarda]|uniref:Transcriptional regulator n=1 Tax=Edwardsiella tarda TaxID=636 RepID=A0A2A7TZJ3_EDWTA|nr:winged helix-turn-helix domain-containing protein [Edwardsiella tarda]PEH71576.1 transcriptional regulator [Edwardsiella tarda]